MHEEEKAPLREKTQDMGKRGAFKVSIALYIPDLSCPSQVIEQSPLVAADEPVERHRYPLADVKNSLVSDGAI